jgi:L-amino acid N-acyltransferase YncA
MTPQPPSETAMSDQTVGNAAAAVALNPGANPALDLMANGEGKRPQCSVRRATEDDRFALFKLAVAMHRETDYSAMRFDPAKALDRLGAWLHSPEGVMLVAESDGEVVGMLAATCRAPWFSDELMASEDLFFVRPDKRAGRTALRLLQAFINGAESLGVRHIRAGIATGKAGAPAARLYEHVGFTLSGGSYAMFLGAKK